ncbi:NAD-dependent deacylase [Parahaliea mediterranea]|uniref:NAD-dependent protein deacylase n=1 Tax=Parahaliea mediterranea TaxID=651086 RepID=A0A939DGE2_9GAMM|nr:NAD-dependent deacylase [Parahaliea mediterranea]MBN7797691.1 NAD-dependent deacylase [Parahaliea mediterranea]
MLYYKQRAIDQIVILTGAGISAASGLATFRDTGGLWENHDPMDIATPEAFARDPDLVYRFYNERRQQLRAVQPNVAHRALARLQQTVGQGVFLVTQNVDDLHERGGSEQACHMHGELQSMLCRHCGQRQRALATFDGKTACPACGERGGLRPDVVWFGEMPHDMDRIEAHLADCDLFIAVGTSGAVYPAAGFVQLARHAGAITVEVNREASDVAGFFHHHYVGCATDQVGLLVDELLAARVG